MKKILATSFFCLSSLILSAFDWPQKEILSDSFYSYFGQLRGNTISSSLIFSESGLVKSCNSGRILAVISEHSEGDFFESTLGNAVILSHDDNMLTVYANLDGSNVDELLKTDSVASGMTLGNVGTSGWQEGEGCLEFQVVDTKNCNFINPRVLMPRIGNELDLSIKNVTAVSRAGTSFNLGTQKTLTSGVYSLYKERQDTAVPYKTDVFINGASVESISYDTIVEKNGKLCLKGKKFYPVESVYPDDNRQLLGEITIPRGKDEITIVISDILGKERFITYTIDVR